MQRILMERVHRHRKQKANEFSIHEKQVSFRELKNAIGNYIFPSNGYQIFKNFREIL